MRYSLVILFAFSTGLPLAAARAEPAPGESRAPRLFDAHEPLAIELEADWSALQRDRSETPTPRPAVLRYAGPSGPVTLSIQLETRGRSRLRKTVCEFPPLLLDIPKDARKGTLFRGIGELKLVTHCQRSPKYEQNVLLEYLVYRSYNALSDHSYRVRLLQVSYRDPGAKKPRWERAGFVIEDASNLTKRVGAERVAESTIDPALIDPVAAARVEMFFYMIGMTDFSLIARPDGPCCHNARALKMPGGRIVPVPFDFDQTGVVDPEYALPDPRLGIRSVTQRKFRGMCRPSGEHAAAIAELQAKRAEITALFDGLANLMQARRQRALKFIEGFYTWAADGQKVEKTLSAECRQKSA